MDSRRVAIGLVVLVALAFAISFATARLLRGTPASERPPVRPAVVEVASPSIATLGPPARLPALGG